MRQYCIANGLPAPQLGLNIWVSNSITTQASAPMLRSVANTSLASSAIDLMLPLIGGASKKRLVQRYLPDITIHIKSGSTTRSAADISGTIFHELAHAVHYGKVGNNYWAAEIAYTVNNGGYGTKTTSGSGRPAVVEAWGYFIGPTFNRSKYLSNSTLADSELKFLEFQKRNDNITVSGFNGSVSQGWIPWGMLHDLTDIGEPSITLINDQASGYTINGIFKGYNSNSTTVQSLKSEILSNNGNSQATQVNNLVTSYGW